MRSFTLFFSVVAHVIVFMAKSHIFFIIAALRNLLHSAFSCCFLYSLFFKHLHAWLALSISSTFLPYGTLAIISEWVLESPSATNRAYLRLCMVVAIWNASTNISDSLPVLGPASNKTCMVRNRSIYLMPVFYASTAIFVPNS